MMQFFNETTFTNKNETFDPVLHIHTLNYAIFQNNKAYWHHSQPLATIVKGLSNLKPFRIKIILKRILLKDETKNI